MKAKSDKVVKPMKPKSDPAPAEPVKQFVYMTMVGIEVPSLKINGVEFEQERTGFVVLTQEYPTVENLTKGFDDHPTMSVEPRGARIRELFLDGLSIWGIPSLLNYGSMKVSSVNVHWVLNGVQKNGESFVAFEAGYLMITRKEIVQ